MIWNIIPFTLNHTTQFGINQVKKTLDMSQLLWREIIISVVLIDLWEYNEDNNSFGAFNGCCALPRADRRGGGGKSPRRSAGARVVVCGKETD
jgi:hypothetical protein